MGAKEPKKLPRKTLVNTLLFLLAYKRLKSGSRSVVSPFIAGSLGALPHPHIL